MKKLDKDLRLTIQFALSAVLTVSGLILLFISLYLPEKGKIDPTVLTAYSEISVFSGSLMGIDGHYRYAQKKLEFEASCARLSKKRGKRDDDDEDDASEEADDETERENR